MPNLNREQNTSNLFLFFSIFWCISTLVHQLIWTEWFSDTIPLAWVISFLCVAHLITFGKYKILFVLAIISSAFWYVIQQPLVVNHLYFETIISLLMTTVVIGYYLKQRLTSTLVSLPAYFTDNAFPLLRSSIIILYFFVVLHKLNYDFFKTDISCGAVLFENMLHNLQLTRLEFIENFYENNQHRIANFSIYFSIIAELLIPILLLFKRTRNLGLVFAMVFHFILALEGLGAIVSFTTMMFTYLLLFSSDELIEKAIRTTKKYQSYLRLGFMVALVIIAISFIISHNIFNKVVGLIWLIYSISVIIFFARNIKLHSNNAVKLSSKSLIYWIFPLLVFVNGFAPYLGLKTQTSFSMFSNLITENGRTNHFFIPNEFQVFDYQKELVYIDDTNMKNLLSDDVWNKGVSYNYLLFEFVKKVKGTDEGYVKFKVNNTSHYIEKHQGKVIKSSINLNQNSILNKLLLFRPVYSKNISYCQQ